MTCETENLIKTRMIGNVEYKPIFGTITNENGKILRLKWSEDIILDLLSSEPNELFSYFTIAKVLQEKGSKLVSFTNAPIRRIKNQIIILRKKLDPFEIVIITKSKRGYYLEDTTSSPEEL